MSIRRVEIVGGGIVGLSLGAALAREGIPTTVFEAGDYPRHRVCGEFIAGLTEREMSTLRLTDILAGAVPHRSIAWFCRNRPVGRQTLATPAWGLSRLTLDKRLADSFVEAGGQLRTHARVETSSCPQGRVLTTGRQARPSNWVGLKMHVRGVTLAADLEVHLGGGSYVGLCGVEDGWTNVCGLFPRNYVSRNNGGALLPRALVASGLTGLETRLREAEVREKSEVVTAGLGYENENPRESILRLGDAVAMIPPFTGHGMAMAFRSAATALPALHAWATGMSSWARAAAETNAAIRAETRRRLWVARAIHPWMLQPFRQRLFGIAHRAKILPVGFLTRVLHG